MQDSFGVPAPHPWGEPAWGPTDAQLPSWIFLWSSDHNKENIWEGEGEEPTPVISLWGKEAVKEHCAAIQEVIYFRQLGLNIKLKQYWNFQ